MSSRVTERTRKKQIEVQQQNDDTINYFSILYTSNDRFQINCRPFGFSAQARAQAHTRSYPTVYTQQHFYFVSFFTWIAWFGHRFFFSASYFSVSMGFCQFFFSFQWRHTHTKVDTKPSDCDLFLFVRFCALPNFFFSYFKKNYNNNRIHTNMYKYEHSQKQRPATVFFVSVGLYVSHPTEIEYFKEMKINK